MEKDPTYEELKFDTEEQQKQIADLNKQLDDLKNADQAEAQQLQMQGEQMQKQLQQVIVTKASTLGQIAGLEQTVRELERSQHQIEGALNALQAMTG